MKREKMLFKRGKNGQFGLEKIFSYIIYGLAVMVFIVLVNLPGCILDKGQLKAVIESDATLKAEVKAEAQLNSYLRAQMPDKALLFERLDWLKNKKKEGYVFAGQFDEGKVKRVKEFTDGNPEAYVGKDYSGFISSLQAIYAVSNNDGKNRIKEAFELVTAAMFFRSARDKTQKIGHVLYALPIAVDFDPKDLKPSRTDYSLCTLEKDFKEFEVCSDNRPYELFYAKFWQAVQAVPLHDGGFAKVELRYYPEPLSWLPKP